MYSVDSVRIHAKAAIFLLMPENFHFRVSSTVAFDMALHFAIVQIPMCLIY